MPIETQLALTWALKQIDINGDTITIDSPHDVVDKVREYFNTNNITYDTFSYDDLIPYLMQLSE